MDRALYLTFILTSLELNLFSQLNCEVLKTDIMYHSCPFYNLLMSLCSLNTRKNTVIPDSGTGS